MSCGRSSDRYSCLAYDDVSVTFAVLVFDCRRDLSTAIVPTIRKALSQNSLIASHFTFARQSVPPFRKQFFSSTIKRTAHRIINYTGRETSNGSEKFTSSNRRVNIFNKNATRIYYLYVYSYVFSRCNQFKLKPIYEFGWL